MLFGDSVATLELSCGLLENDRSRAILRGDIRPEAICFRSRAIQKNEMASADLRGEFDVMELPLVSLIAATSEALAGKWLGIPVFTRRGFFHTELVVRNDAGTDKPEDLNGKLVAAHLDDQTEAIWARGILREEFGVRTTSVASAGPAQLLARREVDAMLSVSEAAPEGDSFRRLFEPPSIEAHRYYKQTAVYPISHALAVRRSLAERYPWIVLNIFKAFREAQDRLVVELDWRLEPDFAAGTLDEAARAALHSAVMPYGVRSARKELESIVRFAYEDAVTPRCIGLNEIFAEQTLDL